MFIFYSFFYLAERALKEMRFDILHGRAIDITWADEDHHTSMSSFIKLFSSSIVLQMIIIHFPLSLFVHHLAATDNLLSTGNFSPEHIDSDDFDEIDIDNDDDDDENRTNDRSTSVRSQSSDPSRPSPSTNLYVKNFGDELDDDSFYELFRPYGRIVSYRVRYIHWEKLVYVATLFLKRLVKMKRVNRKVLVFADSEVLKKLQR